MGMPITKLMLTPLSETTGSERHQPLPALTGIAAVPSISSAARAMRAKRRMLVLLIRPPRRESTGGPGVGRGPMGEGPYEVPRYPRIPGGADPNERLEQYFGP